MVKLIRILLVSFLSLSILVTCKKKENTLTPNVILILVDNLGMSDLHFLNGRFPTPNLDKLSEKSVVFDLAYTASSISKPSRASIFSGQHPVSHGIYESDSVTYGPAFAKKLMAVKSKVDLDANCVTIAGLLAHKGYSTANIGKWGISENPLNFGFSFNAGGSNALVANSFSPPFLLKNLAENESCENLDDRLTSESLDFINKNKDKPYFLTLSFYSVNPPLEPKAEHFDLLSEKFKGEETNRIKYAAAVYNIDWNIGRLIDFLEEKDLTENTVIIFSSTNGAISSISQQTPLRGGSGSYYEGGIRIPFFICLPPQLTEVGHNPYLASTLDILPTVLELCGIENKNNDLHLDGISLLKTMTKNENHNRDSLFWHFPVYTPAIHPDRDGGRDPFFQTRPGSAVLLNNWKLIKYFECGSIELFDLKTDPGEMTNLVKQNPEKTEQMLRMMSRWQLKTLAPIPFLENK